MYLIFVFTLLSTLQISELTPDNLSDIGTEVTCTDSEFACEDGSICIPRLWRCDFSPDCPDHSDEPPDCPPPSCEGLFRCKESRTCIPQGWLCDGEQDCGNGDNSDENFDTCPEAANCPPNNFLCDDQVTCLPISYRCDQINQCPDSSDEGDFCGNSTLCDTSQCSHGCRPSLNGSMICFCPEGKMPQGNQCIDYNQCDWEGTCDQHCHIDDQNKINCQCLDGYKQNDSLCSAINDPPNETLRLFYASSELIEEISSDGSILEGNNTSKSVDNLLALDFDHRNRTVCWVNSHLGKTNFTCADVDNLTNVWTLKSPQNFGFNYVHHIALDWVSGNWYILDSREVIFMCNSTFNVCLTLIDVVINKPRGIALDPTSGVMFFTDWGVNDPNPKVERALMDGTERAVIVKTKIAYPFGITLDYPNKHVYWVDGYHSNIQRVDYDGSNRRTIATMQSDESPFAITMIENDLFVTGWKSNTIKRIDRFQFNKPKEIVTIATSILEPLSILAFHRERQPQVNHPCGVNNGGCSHFCFPLWSNGEPLIRCKCQPGFVLDKNGNGSCSGGLDSSFLIYAKSHPAMIKGVPLDIPRSSEVIMPITSFNKSLTLDFDVRTKSIFFADNEGFNIKKQTIDGSSSQVVAMGFDNVEGLAVDWMGRNLYWTDEGLALIIVCSLREPSKRQILVTGALENVRALALDPSEGLMFWSIWEFPDRQGKIGLIETSWMDGSHREILVSDGLHWPNGLTIDYKSKLLYWCDGFFLKIESIKFDGTQRSVVLEGDQLHHPYGLSYYNNYIYWSEYQKGSIVRMNLKNKDVVILQEENPNVFDIKIYSEDRQKGSNGCEHVSCGDFCFATPDGSKCGCRMGFETNLENPLACSVSKNFSLPIFCKENQFLCNKTLHCIEKNFVCDGENDCLDNSDEDRSPGGICEQVECKDEMFQCGNNKCIEAMWVCDGDYDCPDRTDELEEHCLCKAGQFECTSGKCIPQSWVCDMGNDCGPGDTSDEHKDCVYGKCEDTAFTCGDRFCIPSLWVCDNDADCADGSDELYCAEFCKRAELNDFPLSPFCSLNCNNITDVAKCASLSCVVCEDASGTCISAVQVCDHMEDCPSGIDETNCSTKAVADRKCHKNEFLCVGVSGENECLPAHLKCDGHEDCLDGSDESDCLNIKCSEGSSICTTGKQCVFDSLRCDGKFDCKDHSDEENCPEIFIDCLMPDILCDNETKCVPSPSICDHYDDCHDGSDEGGKCEDNDCELINCEWRCKQNPTGPYCLCPTGQTLLKDGKSCTVKHPCEQWGICSQICVPLKDSSYKCSCQSDFLLENDDYSCKPIDNVAPYILFSNRHELRRLQFSTDRTMTDKALISSLTNTIALDFHISADEEEEIYWTDLKFDKIYRGSVFMGALTNINVVVETGLATAEGLAVDWMGENLYWVESNLDQIEVSKLNGSFRRSLISIDMESPRAIALDPREGILFWSDWEEKNARIESASMSGEGRRLVVRVSDIKDGGWPNGLTLDYNLKRIYWIDAKSDSIHCALYDGSDNREVLRSHERLSHAFAISLYGLNVYWTDWSTNSVFSANKFNGSNIQLLQSTSTQPFDIQIVHPSRQPKAIYNPCKENNGGCSHLCLLSFNSTRQCNCPQIMNLDSDNLNCLRKEKILVLAKPNEIIGFEIENASLEIMTRIGLTENQTVVPIDFASEDAMIYWVDVKLNRIYRANMSVSPSEKQTIVDTAIDTPKGFAIDWVSNNMFIGSSGPYRKQISVATIEGEFLMPIITEEIYEIESMAVDPYQGKIFWSDVGSDVGHSIQMATMMGTNRQVLTSRKDNKLLDYPTSLVFDPHSKRLFWINKNSNTIQHYDFRNKSVNVLLIGGNTSNPVAIAVYKDFLYYFDRMNNSIYRTDKYTGSGKYLIQSDIEGTISLKIYDKTFRKGSNACSKKNTCAHLCIPINGNERQCHCAVGYRIDPTDPTTCIGEEGVLIYSTNHGLGGINLRRESNVSTEEDFLSPISQVGIASRLDFHADQDLLVWADKNAGTITTIHRDGTNRKVILTDHHQSIDGLAVDWIANTVYWSNPRVKIIEMCKLRGSERYTIIADNLKTPGALAIHPVEGFLFWVDIGGEMAKIERSRLDGSSREIIANSSLGYPIDLAIDYQKNVIYFVDNELKKLEKMFLDGSSRQIVLDLMLTKFVSVFIFEDSIYTASVNEHLGAIHSVDQNSYETTSIGNLQSNYNSLSSIIVMSHAAQTGTNKCDDSKTSRSSCSDLCFFNGTDAVCKCFHGKIGSDGKTCEEYDAFLLYSNNTSIESLHLFDTDDPNPPIKSLAPDSMKNAISLTFDYSSKRVFYSDLQRRSIHSVHFNGSNHEIVADGQKSVEGIAFEEIQKNLYWTCQNDASINRMSLSPKKKADKIVRLSTDDKPRGIAVDGCRRRVYWTNWNSKAPSIQSSYLNGVNVTSIITTRIKMPNALVIDHMAQKIYWGDARLDFIERCNMDGTDRVVLLEGFPNHPFDLAVYHDYIFWTDWGLQAVVRANKYTGKEITKLKTKIPRLMGIIAVANDTNACQSSLCLIGNGGCEDICQLDERAQVFCSCGSGRFLMKDGRRCSSTPTTICSDDELPCTSGFCIPYSFFCDKVAECPDESDEDEKFCAFRKCKEGYFRCDDGMCIPDSNVCDGVLNCRDFTDESGCACGDEQFRCADSGVCLPNSLKCDVELDCQDASDEMGCDKTNCSTMFIMDPSKAAGLINCANTTNCIHPKWICDGVNDCWDNSDEQNCDTTVTNLECDDVIHHKCLTGSCIPKMFFCDGQDDCRDGNSTVSSSDETDCKPSCPKGQFQCESDNKCIYGTWKCDGIDDCRDGSDEPVNCDTLVCMENEFKCNSTGRCIPKTWVCDGDDDCPDADDENIPGGCKEKSGVPPHGCPMGEFTCTMMFSLEAFQCIPMEFYCDGFHHCLDGSDEPESCSKFNQCLENQFSCKNENCIPRVWVCNGKDDCNDNSDEENCGAINKTTSGLDSHQCEDNFRCNNSICVTLEKLCDGQDDCGDFSDEKQCNINECLMTNPKPCAHKCIDKKIGYACECRKGFEINTDDSRFCDDINECEEEFPCSQSCINTVGSYKCSCHDGYITEDVGRTCRANTTELAHLIISIRFFIREVGLEDMFRKLIVDNLTNVVALDFEWTSQCFYWSDVTHLSSSIKRICKDGQLEELHTTVQSPDGIAVDWVGKNLYWCDKGKDTIEVSKLDGKYRKILINDGLQDPRAIVLDPFHGYMYWTDWGSQPHIGKAGMDGSEQQILINSTRVGWPNALTISYATEEIFWADAHYDYIGRCDLDGGNRKVILSAEKAPNYVRHIFAISVFEDWLYWTDWELKSVIRANKYTGRDINKVYTAMHRPMDIHVYHPYRQLPVKNNPCEDGGGCSTMCLLAPGGNKTCVCPENYVLHEDAQSCSSNCSSFQFECNSTFKCIPFFWRCDTQDDCGDKSDEPPDCPAFNCTPGQFQCKNGNCIHPSQICDSEDQCKDQSDELDCDEYTCMPSHFKCPATNETSAFCIPKKEHCNGKVDCPGGEDEECIPRTCPSNLFKCNNSQCIPLGWVCDQDNDCFDASDEQAICPFRKCQENEFRCNNGRCIPNAWKCDGEYDCRDREDERNCTDTHSCNPLYFECANNRCIPSRWNCDGEEDCTDGSDEKNCTVVTCSPDEFTCHDGGCVLSTNLCDGITNCRDGSDELNCSPENCTEDQFMCVDHGTCILKQWVCDDDADCSDNSDEENCDNKCVEGITTACDKGGCIQENWICDGTPDCQDASDEKPERCLTHQCHPHLFRCNNGICLTQTKLCDGVNDCEDGSDENSESCHCVGESKFECDNHHCIHKSLVCDGFNDCLDESDENNCPTGCWFGLCSQICNAKKNESHSCSCAKGYTQLSGSQKDEKSCFANGNLAYMILANDNHLRMLSPYKHGNSAGMFTLTQEDATKVRIESVDVLYGEEPRIFWTNRHEKTLVTMKIPNTETSERNPRFARETSAANAGNYGHIQTLIEGLSDPRGVAVEWITKTIYYIDSGEDTISAITTDGKKRVTLINTGIFHPFDLAVDPLSGQLFWTKWGYNPKIEVARLDGSEPKTLVQGGMVWPSGIAIDYPARRLYWTDTKTQTIETIGLDGKERRVIFKFANDEEKPNKIDIFEDLLYLSTLNTNTVYRMSKFGGKQNKLVKISQYPLKLSDIVLVQEQKHDTSIENPCVDDPCGEVALCLLSGPKTFSCLCPDQTIRRSIENSSAVECEEKKIVGGKCDRDCHVGECIVTFKGPRCHCPPLYKGPNCNVYRCSGYCKNGGRCKPDPKEETATGVPKLNCFCPPNWSGDRCDKASKACRGGFCANGGTCVEGGHQHSLRPYCHCPANFTGLHCERCKNLKCENGGRCQMNRGTINCSCAPGYHGDRCQYSVCNGVCQNGICELKEGQPICRCNGGWSGPRCFTDLCQDDKCVSCDIKQCDNGGECRKNVDTKEIFCKCEKGFLGTTCSQSECDNYCEHDGICKLDDGIPVCNCTPGYSGLTCAKNDCENLCISGICRNTSAGAVCECERGYTGRRCELIQDNSNCSPGPCLNGGTCINLNNMLLVCLCTYLYEGETCERRIESLKNPCRKFTCLNNGICQSIHEAPHCVCPPGRSGSRCEFSPRCESKTCLNGGTCLSDEDRTFNSICSCAEGFFGAICESSEEDGGITEPFQQSSVTTIILAVLFSVITVMCLLIAFVVWRRKGKGIGHVRLQENGGTVELTNPMYLHSPEYEEENEPIFTLHDSQSTTNFKNPVYDIIYDGASNLSQEEKAELLQSDPLGVLDNNSKAPNLYPKRT